VHASPRYAAAVARLLALVDAALDRPAELAFVDMAAGRGELAAGVLAALPPELASRTRAYAVEIAGRPDGLDPRIEWRAEPPEGVTGLLFANEWLDNVPVDVAETDAAGVRRRVLVRRDGTERLGEPVTGPEADWLERWWPLPEPAPTAAATPAAAQPPASSPAQPPAPSGEAPYAGLRAEIGLPRDTAWAAAVGSLARGLAVAVDYAHTRDARPPFGTLTAFREGRETRPVPDGRHDLTAHVALDACAGPGARLLTQREALRALGVTGARPPLALAATDPAAYVRALASAGEAAELTAPGGLGDFGWLLQPVGLTDVPL
jgi:SAM-dependent MidA family methyltransferase